MRTQLWFDDDAYGLDEERKNELAQYEKKIVDYQQLVAASAQYCH